MMIFCLLLCHTLPVYWISFSFGQKTEFECHHQVFVTEEVVFKLFTLT